MTIQVPIFGNQLGLNHAGELVGNQHAHLSGYNSEVIYTGESLVKVTVTTAQVLALFATPITILDAAPTGFVNVFSRAAIYKPAGTAYGGIAAGEDLVFKATNAAGQQISSVVETTGFLDQATAQLRYVGPPGAVTTTAADVTPLNAAIVLHLLTAEIIDGTSDLIVWLWYHRLPTVLTA